LVPILNFRSGQYSGQCVKLDPEIFNLPLRRDIVHRVQVYESKKGLKFIHASKTLANVLLSDQGI
jgi:ribosomal protein L4